MDEKVNRCPSCGGYIYATDACFVCVKERIGKQIKTSMRFLIVAGLSVGIVFASAAQALEPKLIILTKLQPRAFAKTLVSVKEFACLDKLWKAESHWNARAKNPSSDAYGIAQFMPQTWHNYNLIKTSNPYKQITYGIHYINNRYQGSPCLAWKHEQTYNWY